MALIGNVTLTTGNKLYGDFNLHTGQPNYYGQYTAPAVTYNVDNCTFINNASGSQDQIKAAVGAVGASCKACHDAYRY